MTRPTLPSADQCAAAIVRACREVGEDPVSVAEGASPSRGRAYAFHALRACFPDLRREATAALVGARDPRLTTHSMKVARYQTRWWSDDTLAAVVAAVRDTLPFPAVDAPAPQCPAVERDGCDDVSSRSSDSTPPQPSSLADRPIDVAPRAEVVRRAQDHWADRDGDRPVRHARRSRLDVTADLCGDPLPGRSALDQRRMAPARDDGAPSLARTIHFVDRQDLA